MQFPVEIRIVVRQPPDYATIGRTMKNKCVNIVFSLIEERRPEAIESYQANDENKILIKAPCGEIKERSLAERKWRFSTRLPRYL